MSATPTDRSAATHRPSAVWSDVVGQPDAIARLDRAAQSPVHAYLFVGPSGSTKLAAARAFAALVLAGSPTPEARDLDLARRGEHPDITEVRRAGPSISFEQAREIVRTAALAPNEGSRKVMILHEFHLVRPEGAALLLKTIEEPPPSTTFLILAEFVPHDLVTISSRCARIDFRPIGEQTIEDHLIAEGTDPETAAEAAAASAGHLDRARLLATDPALGERRRAFARVPSQLDGTGRAVMLAVEELMALIEAAAAPLAERHTAELAALAERVAQTGERGSGRKAVEDRHRRELRRHRTDELVAGLATMAGTYRDALVAGQVDRPDAAVEAVAAIHAAIGALDHNPNETLLLQSLLWSLPVLRA